jgi:hypothetical protein
MRLWEMMKIMSDNYYYYKDQVRELQNGMDITRKSTLGSVLNKLIWLKENGGTIDHAIEYVMLEMRK